MNASDRLADLYVVRQLILQRLVGGEQRAFNKLLDNISGEIEKLLIGQKPLTSYNVQRLNKAISELAAIVQVTAPDIGDLAALEANFTVGAFGQLGLTATLPSATTLQRIATTSLIEGATIGQWFGRLQEETRFQLSRAVKLGVSLGETNAQILKRIVSVNEKGSEVFAQTRRNGMAIVRTSVQTISNEVRQATFQENEDLVDGVQWLSTLDGRTSDICIARSGLVWTLPKYKPKGHKIPWNGGPPAHWNCRSTTIPVLKSLEEMGVDPEGIPPATRSSMDGQVAADLTFADFLKGKPPEFADEMLGKGRAQLWRDGKITLSQLLDQRGNPLTLAELGKRYGGAVASPTPTRTAAAVTANSADTAINNIRNYRLSATSLALERELQQIDADLLPKIKAWNALRPMDRSLRADEGMALIKSNQERGRIALLLDRQLEKDRADMLNLIAIPKGKRAAAADFINGSVPKPLRGKVDEATALLSQLIHKDIAPKVKVLTQRKARAGYSHSEQAIYLKPSKTNVSTVAHEIVHDIEYRHPEVSRLTKEFLFKRGGGADPVSLRQLTGGKGYGVDEVTLADKWAARGGSPYIGRLYNRPSTEILTMGIERLLANPKKFQEQDPEYFEFLIKILHKAF